MINLSCHWTRGWVLSYFEPSWLVDQRLPFDQPIVIKHWPPTSFCCENMTPDASEWDADARTNHPWDNWLIPHHFVEWKRRDFVRKKTVLCTHPFHFYVCAYNEEFRFYSSSEFAQLWVGQRKANTSCLRLAIREWLREQKHKTTNMSQLILCNATMICNEHSIFNLYSVERNNMMFLIPGMLHLQKLNNFLWEQKSIGIWLFHAKWNLLCVFLSSIGVLSNLLFF